MRLFFLVITLVLSGCSMPGTKHDLPTHEPLRQGPRIPGLEDGAVPQGLAFLPGKNLLLISYYYTDGRPSVILAMDWATGAVEHATELQEPDGSPHRGHVGGIEIVSSNLWVASDSYLYGYTLNDILEREHAMSIGAYKTEAAEGVAFCSYHDEMLWAGEFGLGKKYPTPAAHHLVDREGVKRTGWVSAHTRESLKSTEEAARTELALSIPDKAQDILFVGDHVLLSCSYGRMRSSMIAVYSNPLYEPPHELVQTSMGAEAPLWFLDGANLEYSFTLPPMTENMVLIDGELVILFESGARKYRRFGRNRQDHFMILDLSGLLGP